MKLIRLVSSAGTHLHAVPVTANDPAGARRSSQWEGKRNNYLRQHPFCAACGRKTHLNVHHIKPFHEYPELELVESNFIGLCEYPSLNCHLYMGHLLDWKSSNPRVQADAKRFLAMIKKIRGS